MNKKTALITGASSGFGLLTAIELAKNGFHVIATVRDLNRTQALEDLIKENKLEESIQIHRLDVTSAESIAELKQLVKSFARVDVLVNNAGYAAAGFVEEVELVIYRKQFETNLFGLIAVTQAIIPLMRSQHNGKIINISSISGQIGFPGMSPYVSSKFALEGFSESLRLELKPFGIDVVLIEPGSYKTDIWEKGKNTAAKINEESFYYQYVKKFTEEIERNKEQFGDPVDVAKLITKIALQRKVKLRYPIGKGIKTTVLFKRILPWSILEKLIIRSMNTLLKK